MHAKAENYEQDQWCLH